MSFRESSFTPPLPCSPGCARVTPPTAPVTIVRANSVRRMTAPSDGPWRGVVVRRQGRTGGAVLWQVRLFYRGGPGLARPGDGDGPLVQPHVVTARWGSPKPRTHFSGAFVSYFSA